MSKSAVVLGGLVGEVYEFCGREGCGERLEVVEVLKAKGEDRLVCKSTRTRDWQNGVERAVFEGWVQKGLLRKVER